MIADKDLKKLEKLAKLSISDEDRGDFCNKLDNMIAMIDKLHEVPCENIEPLRSVCEMYQRFREDEVTVQDSSKDLFKNIPDVGKMFASEVKCFIVPKVIE
jgi:aspartyl-tRNA(Asn)/glutamyl-tRNA(Gln) amidotransferase subunit C